MNTTLAVKQSRMLIGRCEECLDPIYLGDVHYVSDDDNSRRFRGNYVEHAALCEACVDVFGLPEGSEEADE